MGNNISQHHYLYDSLTSIVGAKYVADEDFALFTYSRDLDLYPGKIPGIIVRPETTEQVREVVRLANRTQTPVIARGGNCSMDGFRGGDAGRNIVIDMTRMDKIIKIDEESMIVTVEAGTTISKMKTELGKRGLILIPVTMPVYSDTVGGMISGVTGGGAGLDFGGRGPNWRLIVGFKVVLPNGEILQTGAGPGANINLTSTYFRETVGPDFTGLFINDAGVLGIKTEVTLQVFKKPNYDKSTSFIFDTLEEILNAQFNLLKTTILVDTIYGFNPEMLKFALNLETKSFCLIVTVRGDSEDEVDFRLRKVENICQQDGGKPGSDEMNALSKAVAGGALADLGGVWSKGVYAAADSTLPREGFVKVYNDGQAIRQKYIKDFGKLGIISFDHFEPFGCNNGVFFAVGEIYDNSNPEAKRITRAFMNEIKLYMVRSGGMPFSSKGHYGELMGSVFSPSYSNFFRTLKKAIDPNNIMNPYNFGF